VSTSTVYKRIEDIRGEADTLHKKSLIARVRGDVDLAEEWASRYLSLVEDHFAALSDDEAMGSGTVQEVEE
jgi:hypothetical protein